MTETEMEEERQFFLNYLQDRHEMGYTASWSSRYPTVLLLCALSGREIKPTELPWDKADLDLCASMIEQAPEHLAEKMRPIYNEFREYVAVKLESKKRNAALAARAANV